MTYPSSLFAEGRPAIKYGSRKPLSKISVVPSAVDLIDLSTRARRPYSRRGTAWLRRQNPRG
jgi:hypothetical protein